ncbi:MAG: cell envelope-related transcriptional attenuator [Candidatus Peregrinibacteria bacterium Gr01-1014_25]|nr:MAG: cell envelope-related transcriptional attenuator [Candidatus Peregrinibacteria bacterium Gr01-1014_25]
MMSFSVRRISDDSSRRRIAWKPLLGNVLFFARPLMQLYGAWRQQREADERAERRRHALRIAMTVAAALALAALLWMGTARAWMFLKTVGLRTALNIAATELPRDALGHTNLLLLGQGDSAGQDLTDTLMIASLDARGSSAVLLSLPRDLHFLERKGLPDGKVNNSYRDYKVRRRREGLEPDAASLQALRDSAQEIGSALQLDIHGVVKVDFEGFVQAVDAIGGVDVAVPEDIVDTQFPTADYGYETFAINAGPQHLDGATALKYARTRHTSSDFDRSARQQQILKAMAARVREQGLLGKARTVAALQSIVAEHVETTLDLGMILALGKMAAESEGGDVHAMQINDRNGLYEGVVEPGGFLYTPPRELFGGQSVLLPVSIPEFPVTWKQLQMLKRLFIDMRTPYAWNADIAILNAGAKSGVARTLGNEFVRYGFPVGRIANASMPDQETSFIAAGGDSALDAAKFFGAFLDLPVQDMPAGLPAEERGAVTIVLGEDYAYTPFQNLSLPQ